MQLSLWLHYPTFKIIHLEYTVVHPHPNPSTRSRARSRARSHIKHTGAISRNPWAQTPNTHARSLSLTQKQWCVAYGIIECGMNWMGLLFWWSILFCVWLHRRPGLGWDVKWVFNACIWCGSLSSFHFPFLRILLYTMRPQNWKSNHKMAFRNSSGVNYEIILLMCAEMVSHKAYLWKQCDCIIHNSGNGKCTP